MAVFDFFVLLVQFLHFCSTLFAILCDSAKLRDSFSYTCLLRLEPSNCSCIPSSLQQSSKLMKNFFVTPVHRHIVYNFYVRALFCANIKCSHNHKLIRIFGQYCLHGSLNRCGSSWTTTNR